jgi:hypothetical protein
MNRNSWLQLAFAVGVAVAFAVLVTLRFTGPMRSFLIGYFAPIVVPFVLWLIERWDLRASYTRPQFGLDALVLVVSALRATDHFPLVSGHALFLVYALGTTRSPIVLATAMVVLAEVVFLKLFVWRDITLWVGVVVGMGLVALWRRLADASQEFLRVRVNR